MSTPHFYRDIAPFRDFVREAFDPSFYAPLPSDWVLLVADVVGSTRAVDAGKYAAVNYLGAACIVAVNNALAGLAVPTVFGGDGATIAVPAEARESAVGALIATRRWGRECFALELRVGAVPVSEIERRGASLAVAKMAFSPNNTMAMFRGDGFDLADRLVKEDEGGDGFAVADDDIGAQAPDLSDLSCRWAPSRSEHGHMLCLIVGARARDTREADAVYRRVLARIDAIAPLGGPQTSPVKLSNLRFRLRPDALRKEVKTVGGPWWRSWPGVLRMHLLALLLFTSRLNAGGFEPERYRREVVLNSDFRKVNGMLRLIVDCTVAQCDAIESELSALHADGQVVFGAHRASHAIMTCVTPDVVNNEHVHYIDGSEGGLWSAAKGLKSQLAALG